MDHIKSYIDFSPILEKKGEGALSSLWSVMTLGGYVSSKLKNAFGLKSILIKGKVSRIDNILKDGLKNLVTVLPSDRYVQSVVAKNEHLVRLGNFAKLNKVGVDSYEILKQQLMSVEKAILTYEPDRDLETIKANIEKQCDELAGGKQIQLTSQEKIDAEIAAQTKDLRLNKNVVHELTQKLPRYDLKNLALEVSSMTKDDGDRNHRLEILWQKTKNKIFSKYEKFYDFDELNNWLDYERNDPAAFKYREQAKKDSQQIVRNNNIVDIMPAQHFKPKLSGKYYYFFEEN